MAKALSESAFDFKPFSVKQLKILNWWRDGSPYKDYDIVIADGAIRSGKTVSMICSFLIFTQENFTAENFIIAGKSIGTLKRNVIKPMMKILQSWNWNFIYNRSENYLIIGSNTYFLFGANTEASQDTIQGLTAAGAMADEVALFPQSFTDQMLGRCSVAGAKIFMNCNPRNPQHYFKTEYIDKAAEKKIFYLHFTMEDNLALSKTVKERFRRMFTGVFYKRYILGLWTQAEGIIYDMFSDENIAEELPASYYSYYVACDYGTQNPMVYLLFGKAEGRWYIIKEYYYDGRSSNRQKTDDEYYRDLQEFLKGIPLNSIVIDPSAASFITLIRRKGEFAVRKAKNDVAEGIRLTAGKIAARDIMINRNCKNTIKEFYSYVWDTKALDRGEDIPLKQNDHAMDCIRYFVNTVLTSGTDIFR